MPTGIPVTSSKRSGHDMFIVWKYNCNNIIINITQLLFIIPILHFVNVVCLLCMLNMLKRSVVNIILIFITEWFPFIYLDDLCGSESVSLSLSLSLSLTYTRVASRHVHCATNECDAVKPLWSELKRRPSEDIRVNEAAHHRESQSTRLSTYELRSCHLSMCLRRKAGRSPWRSCTNKCLSSRTSMMKCRTVLSRCTRNSFRATSLFSLWVCKR